LFSFSARGTIPSRPPVDGLVQEFRGCCPKLLIRDLFTFLLLRVSVAFGCHVNWVFSYRAFAAELLPSSSIGSSSQVTREALFDAAAC